MIYKQDSYKIVKIIRANDRLYWKYLNSTIIEGLMSRNFLNIVSFLRRQVP